MKPNASIYFGFIPELACAMWVLAAARNTLFLFFQLLLVAEGWADSADSDSNRNGQGCGQDHKGQPAKEVAGRDPLPPVSRVSCP